MDRHEGEIGLWLIVAVLVCLTGLFTHPLMVIVGIIVGIVGISVSNARCPVCRGD